MNANLFAREALNSVLRQVHRAALVLPLLAGWPAWAQFEVANQALSRGDYDGMRAACEPSPHRQTAGCDYILGYLYRYGLGGLPQDFGKAFDILKQGADRGSAGALAGLAHMHRRGEGVPVDHSKAMALYHSAVKAGSAQALSWIGVMHMEGLGVPVDSAAACRWFKAGADKNDPWGRARLATCWRDGLGGFQKNSSEAMKWASLAAEKGNPLGNLIVAQMLRHGEGVKANPAEASKYFRAVFNTPLNIPSSIEPHRIAAYELGLMLLSGTGVEKDEKAAEKMLLTSARLGSAKAMAQLGNIYRLGAPAIPKDGQKAFEWYNAALAIEPVETALHGLARLYQTGQGVFMDRFKARELYEKAIPLGVSDSKLHLAYLLDSGLGGPVDQVRAIKLLKEAMAAKNLHPDNRKSGEVWLARAEKGLPFADAATAERTTVAVASPTEAEQRLRAEEERSRRERADKAVSAPATPSATERIRAEEERSRRERIGKLNDPAALPAAVAVAPAATRPESAPVQPPPIKPVSTPAAAANSATAAAERQTGPSAADLAAQLARLQQQMAALQQSQQVAGAAPPPPKPTAPVLYANRRALVIGNDKYAHVPPLQNAVADARSIARQLEQFGYKVALHTDLNEKGFKQALRDFRLMVEGGDEVLFFFAGHGVQLAAANFLLPVDVKGDNEEQVKDEAIQLQRVLDDFQDRKVKFALAIIDACRDNPFKGSGRAIGGRGLAPTTAATGQMIMFSAGSGQQALDKLGQGDRHPNGLFTRIFLQEMAKGGQPVDRVLRNVRAEVVRLARSIGHEQTPALYDQAIGEFFFKQ